MADSVLEQSGRDTPVSRVAAACVPSRLLLSLVLLLGAEAAATQTGLAPPQRDTAPEELTEVAVLAPEPRYVAPTHRDRIGRIWAPVYLNGQGPFRLVLDTGANRSAVIPRVAEALGDAARTESVVRVRGVTGTAIVPVVRVDRMEIGDLVLEPVMMPVVLDVFGGADGVLGNEGLGNKRIVIDFKRDSITVKRSRRERPGPGFMTLPVKLIHDNLLSTEVTVGGTRALAIIDTGAPSSLGNNALLEALKRQKREENDTQIFGVTLDVERGRSVRVPTIRMHDVTIRDATMAFSDVHIFHHWKLTRRPAIILGMDVLGTLEQIIIDYRTRELHLLTRRRGAGPGGCRRRGLAPAGAAAPAALRLKA